MTTGTQQGNACIIKRGTVGAGVEIAGQGDFTLTIGGELVEITNKSSGGWAEYMDGATTTKTVQFAGTMVYNSSTEFQQIRADFLAGTQADYEIVIGSSNEVFHGKFAPTAMSDTMNLDGSAVQTAITFQSSGEITRVTA